MRPYVVLLLLCFVGGSLQAQILAKRPIQFDDYATLASITDLALSADGKYVAYSEGRWSKAEDNRRTDLWVMAKASPFA
jgi:hypothetical protein